MIRLYECLRHEHDWRLVCIAALICLISAFAAGLTLDRIKTRSGAPAWVWVVATSAIVGFGIWATHFVAMLAYEPSVGFAFDQTQTLLSLLIIIGMGIPAFTMIGRLKHMAATLGGAALLGLGISAMHYTGMYGLLPKGFMRWDPVYIGISIACGVVFTIAAVFVNQRFNSLKGRIGSALLLTLAICLDHFFGMSALTLIPLPEGVSAGSGLSPVLLGGFIGAGAFILLQGVILAALLDAYLVRKRQSQRRSAEELRSLLSSVGTLARIGAWSLQADTKALDWTEEVRALHRLSDSEPITLDDAASFFDGEARKQFQDGIAAALEGKGGFDLELQATLRKGHTLWVRVVCEPLTEQGRVTRLVGAYQDVTRHRIERETLTVALTEADRVSQVKTEFLANMSHELRTPLNGILGMADLLQRTDLDERQDRFAQTITTSGNSLLSLINDILDMSRLEAGLMELDETVFDIDALLTDAINAVMGIALQKGLSVSYELRGVDSGLFLGDTQRLRQVLVNLLGNALKFTEKGLTKIIVTPTHSGQLCFNVVDSGPGIPNDKLETIFQRFTQADGSVTRRHGGTGLGLAISQDLTKLMGGTIGVKSVLGKGSNFWFAVPLARQSRELNQPEPVRRHSVGPDRGAPLTAMAQATETSSTSTNDTAFKILVAEDNVVNQAMVMEALHLLDNVAVSIVANGAAAIGALRATSHDLVLMDINMPLMSGDDAIKRIRAANEPYSDVPIVVLTANVQLGKREEYLTIGANAYLPKPINIDQLIGIVETYRQSPVTAATRTAA